MANKVGEIKARLVLDSSHFKKNMDDARTGLDKTTLSANNTRKSMELIQTASLAVGGAVVAAIGASVGVAANFEQAMARVSAVSGATGSDFEALKNIALEMGENTEFSASQAAEALSYLSMAGFNVQEQISSLPSVLQLASSAQIDLGKSADIVSNIMTGFGISAEETGSAVDVLVKTMTTANTDLPMLGEAMKYVAPVAASLGIGIEETAAAVAKMSDAGIQGSQAGTSLRQMMLSLANPVGQTAKAMEELNIKVTDSSGKMKPLPELIGHVADKMEGMTDAQKTQTSAQLVGTEAASGFLSLLKVGEEGLKDYTSELKNSGGTAERVANTQMDTLQGSFKEFQSAVEGVGIKIGDEFLPEFRKIVEFGTDIIRVLGEVNPATVETGLKMAGAASGIGLVGSSIVKILPVLRTLALSMGPAGLIITGVSILGGLLIGLKSNYDSLNEVNLETANSMIAQRNELSGLIDEYDDLKLKSRLSNDEFARFLDINSEIENTVDAKRLEELRKEQELLYDKSGLTNGELDRLVELNGKIIEVVPDANVKLTEQGNVLLENTDAAKKYNEKQLEIIRDELEIQRVNANRDYVIKLEEQKKILGELEDIEEKRNENSVKLKGQEEKVLGLKRDLTKAERDHDKESVVRLSNELHYENMILDEYQDKNEKLFTQFKEKQKSLDTVKEELKVLEEVVKKQIDLEMSQVDLTAKRGEEVEIIEDEIIKLKMKKSSMEKNTKEAFKNTEEYKEGIRAIDQQIINLEKTKGKVREIISNADNLNATLGKTVYKNVRISEYRTGSGASIQYHTGGIAGKNPINQMPKLHSGGLASSIADSPMHNEIDARLLRDEMVLTEAQQFNLMRMIDSNFLQPSNSQSENGLTKSDLDSLIVALIRSGERPISLQLNEREIIKGIWEGVSLEQERHKNRRR